MRPSTYIAAAVTVVSQTLPLALAQPAPPSSLVASTVNLAASLKSSYPNPSIALLPQPFWWWQSGSTIDALLTYGATTGDRQYEALVQNTLLSQATGTNDFMTVDATGNDDQAWWALAALTAAENNVPVPGGAASWLDMARNVFNEQKGRWDPTRCGGGVRWKILEGNGRDGWHYRNSITNGLFFQLAARLAKLTNDADAQAWAEKAYDWTVSVGLVDGEFNVFDGTDDEKGCSDVNHDQWSYNVGVFLHGAAVMAAHTKDGKWTDRTRGFIASAKRTFTNAQTGALFEKKCEAAGTCNSDQVSFKATLAKWLGATAAILPALRTDVAGIIEGAATAVQSGGTTGLGPMESFTALEVVDAALRTQGMGGAVGMIGLASGAAVRKRSVAGRIMW